MTNHLCTIGLGADASKIAGYGVSANERIGSITLEFENTGANDAYIVVKELVSGSYTDVVAGFTVKPRGVVPKNLVIASSKELGIFGSGNTTINVSTGIRNGADRRNAQFTVTPQGRKNWGFDTALDARTMFETGT